MTVKSACGIARDIAVNSVVSAGRGVVGNPFARGRAAADSGKACSTVDGSRAVQTVVLLEQDRSSERVHPFHRLLVMILI